MDSREQTMAKMVNSVVGKMYDVLEEYIDNLNGTPEEKSRYVCALGIPASVNVLMVLITMLEEGTSASYATQILDSIITDLNIQKKQLQDESKTEHE